MAFGIKWNPVKDFERAVSAVSNTTNSFLSQAESGIRRDISALGQNIERNVQDNLNQTLAIFQPGGLNNLGQTLFNRGLTVATGGLMNPDDTKRISGPTNVDRMKTDAINKAASTAREQAAADAQAQIDDSNRQVSTFLASLTGGKMRQPGRSQTLLGPIGGPQNTLLTLR